MYGKKHLFALNNKSPGKVVMGGGSCSKGREFKSQHRILDGHFSHLFVVKIVMCVWKDEKTIRELSLLQMCDLTTKYLKAGSRYATNLL